MAAITSTETDTETTKRRSNGFRTITAKYPSTCRRCGGKVAVGNVIRWARKRGTWHLAAECFVEADQSAAELEAELDAPMPAYSSAGHGAILEAAF